MTLGDPSLPLVGFLEAPTSPSVRLRGRMPKAPDKVSLESPIATFLINLFFLIVTSKWQYSRETELQRQDKDFKRLNKSAIGQRATTADVSDLGLAPF